MHSVEGFALELVHHEEVVGANVGNDLGVVRDGAIASGVLDRQVLEVEMNGLRRAGVGGKVPGVVVGNRDVPGGGNGRCFGNREDELFHDTVAILGGKLNEVVGRGCGSRAESDNAGTAGNAARRSTSSAIGLTIVNNVDGETTTASERVDGRNSTAVVVRVV